MQSLQSQFVKAVAVNCVHIYIFIPCINIITYIPTLRHLQMPNETTDNSCQTFLEKQSLRNHHQNRRQKFCNRGTLWFCGVLDILKIDINSTGYSVSRFNFAYFFVFSVCTFYAFWHEVHRLFFLFYFVFFCTSLISFCNFFTFRITIIKFFCIAKNTLTTPISFT